MEILNVKRATERHLLNNAGSTKIAFEGVDFTPPTSQLYLAVQFTNVRPDDTVVGKDYFKELLTLQVFVIDVKGKGTSNAIAYAEQIRRWFTKGTTFMEAGTRIQVIETPQIAGSLIVENKIMVPVLVSLYADVYL